MVYAWIVHGGAADDVAKFDTQLYAPPPPPAGQLPDTAPGWSDEETLADFMAAIGGMNGARVGTAITPGSTTVDAG